MRSALIAAVALALSICLADAAWAIFTARDHGPPNSCGEWDCEGGIICTCCVSNGCWICDAKGFNGAGRRCSWDPKV